MQLGAMFDSEDSVEKQGTQMERMEIREALSNSKLLFRFSASARQALTGARRAQSSDQSDESLPRAILAALRRHTRFDYTASHYGWNGEELTESAVVLADPAFRVRYVRGVWAKRC